MYQTVRLSAKKLHSINVTYLDERKRRNPRQGLLNKDFDGDHTLDQMKQIEIKIFGGPLF